MSLRTTPLGGTGWAMREALGETWRWYVDAPLAGLRNNVAGAARGAQLAPGWLPASVPGSVVTDLWQAGELPDPYHARNSRAAEWTGARSWVYRRAVGLPALAAGERAVLECDGIDPSGTVFWDGRPLGRAAGPYHHARFAVPDEAAGPGPHRLAVVLDPVPASQPQVGRTELVRVHRPRMNEGWDFCPRFPHQGIWRPLRLTVAAVHLDGVAVRCAVDPAGDGRVWLTGTAWAAGERRMRFVLRDPAGEQAAAADLTAPGRLAAELAVSRPQLWWPRGLGGQPLYTARLELDGAVAWQRSLGFRTAGLAANEGAPPGARGYTAVVNGTVLPLPGWNWVPADAQYGAVRPDRLRHLVQLAARSGARILRVWGGGLIETEEFYDACDRAGLLVWQEFSQSSSGMQSAPASDPAFVRQMTAEARAVVPRLTHHPSLLVWGGGNELDDDGGPLDEERSPVLAALRDTVARLDPGRAWLPTSPSGAPGEHDVHGPWEHQGLRGQHTRCDTGHALAHTEFGVEGMTNRRALHRLVPGPDRWPAGRSSPVYRHLGEWWNNEPLVQASFGGRLAGLDSLLRASQLLQATGLAYAVEADRRRFPRCSMVLAWQLNESYPNAWCTSCVDHTGVPKPAYFAAARAFAPRRVSAKVATSVWAGEPQLCAEAWVWDEAGTPAGSRVLARLRAADGRVLGEARWHLPAPVRHPRPAGALTVPAAGVPPRAPVIWDLTWLAGDGSELDRELMLACTGEDFAPLLDLAPAAVDVHAGPGAVYVTHRAGPVVVGLRALPAGDTPVLVSGDPRPLLPGATRTFTAEAGARLLVESWNTEPVTAEVAPLEATR